MDSLDTRKLGGLRVLFLLLLIGALYSMHKGQDAAWDLKNYHLYNAWALLHGRLTIDLAPVGLQGYFNPLLDLPYFWLGTSPLHHLPRLLAAIQGLCYGALAFVLLRISIRLAEIRQRSYGVADVLAVVIGITGTMVTSQTGTCTNEVPLALLVVLGFYVLLPLCTGKLPEDAARRVVVAALLCGVAAGLKPTAVVFTPAMAAALWFARGCRIDAWRLSLIFVAVAFAAFLAAYGWWGWQLYRLTGNPVFPLFNQIFHSAWVPATAGTDRQFMPRGMLQWVFYPFYWIRKNAYQGGNTFADARYAAAMIAAAFLAASHAWTWRRPGTGDSRPVRFVLVFVAVAYVPWLGLYSILRYAVALEVMTGLIILMSLQHLASIVRWPGMPKHGLTWSMMALAALIIGCSRYTDWGHAPYAGVSFDVQTPAIDPGSMVLMIGQPNAYVIPFVERAEQSEFVGLTWLTEQASHDRLGAATRERIVHHRGSMYAILRDDDAADLTQLANLLPTMQLAQCTPIQSSLEKTLRGRDMSSGLRLCKVIRAG
jgi:hypothetical protein